MIGDDSDGKRKEVPSRKRSLEILFSTRCVASFFFNFMVPACIGTMSSRDAPIIREKGENE
jgi:hypothetical protein